MKKRTLWAFAILMGVFFCTLLYLQARYVEQVVGMRRTQFSSAVKRSLYETARVLELDETHASLQELLGGAAGEDKQAKADSAQAEREDFDAFEKRILQSTGSAARRAILKDYSTGSADSEAFRQKVQEMYLHEKGLLEEEIFSILYRRSSKPLADRLGSLEGELDRALRGNGVDMDYHYYVCDAVSGDTIAMCADYDEQGNGTTFEQVLFASDAFGSRGVLYVHFPQLQRYILSSTRYVVPAIIFTIALLGMFIFTVYSIFRQKKLTEMKNDLINNMTHEFKTPISSISLAAQMLADDSMPKTEASYKRLSGVINDETKRLRFQVEKVLQMSLFDKKGGTFNLEDVAMKPLLEDVVSTFRLKVETGGGEITTNITATDDKVLGDKMHLTNVIFNLLDNALKYKSEERALRIGLTCRNANGRLIIEVLDNGIGIKKEDVKKIFERFYRAHTGNLHDVKGFGLGLAYVKKVVDVHKGSIHAESKYGEWTRFVISLPLLKHS